MKNWDCLLYTSDAADERSSVDLGGRRIIKKKNQETIKGGKWYCNNKSHDDNNGMNEKQDRTPITSIAI